MTEYIDAVGRAAIAYRDIMRAHQHTERDRGVECGACRAAWLRYCGAVAARDRWER